MFSLVPVASIEVGKHFLDLGFHPAAKPLWCDNTPAGIERLIDALRQCGVLRVALQATNPDAHSVTRALAEDGFSSRWSIRVRSGPSLASSYSRCFSSPFSGMDRIGSDRS